MVNPSTLYKRYVVVVQFTKKRAVSDAVGQITLTYRHISVAAMLTRSLKVNNVLLSNLSSLQNLKLNNTACM